jgi:hypothetical protein
VKRFWLEDGNSVELNAKKQTSHPHRLSYRGAFNYARETATDLP